MILRRSCRLSCPHNYPDSKVHGANIGPIWGRQDPGGPHVGLMNFAIWVISVLRQQSVVGWSEIDKADVILMPRWKTKSNSVFYLYVPPVFVLTQYVGHIFVLLTPRHALWFDTTNYYYLFYFFKSERWQQWVPRRNACKISLYIAITWKENAGVLMVWVWCASLLLAWFNFNHSMDK